VRRLNFARTLKVEAGKSNTSEVTPLTEKTDTYTALSLEYVF